MLTAVSVLDVHLRDSGCQMDITLTVYVNRCIGVGRIPMRQGVSDITLTVYVNRCIGVGRIPMRQ